MPSTLIRSSTDEVAIRLTAAFFGVAPSNATLNSYKAEVARVGESAFARNLASAFDNLTNAQLTTTVLNNLGVSAATIGAAGFAALEPAITTLLGAFAKTDRGQIVLNITRLLAGLEGDATYGAAAAAWNASTDSAFQYSSSSTAATSTPVAALGVRLTASADTLSGSNFVAIPVYTPGGDNFINSLQDEDILNGVGSNASLTATLGSVNDAAEAYIEPKLNNVKTVNVEVTGGGANAGIGFRAANDVTAVNVTRVTANNAAVTFGDLPAGTTSLAVSSATTGGTINFQYREDVLTSTKDSLTLALSSVRASALNINEGTDGGADAGYFFETIAATTTGANDIDSLTVQQNGQEDVDGKNKADTTKQSMTVTVASGSLEVNAFNATGLDNLTIAAGGPVTIALNPSANSAALTATNGLNTPDLETLTISGASNVRIDAVQGEATNGLKVDGSAMTGNLRAGVVGGTSANTKFSLTSGSGDDEIRAFGALSGPLATNAGKDSVTIDGGINATGSVATGAGDDTVLVGTAAAPGALNAKGDTLASRRNDNASDTAASIDSGDGNDTVTVGALGNAVAYNEGKADDANADDTYVLIGTSVKTGAGDDTINATTLAEAASIDAGVGNDTLNIQLTGTGVLAGDTNANSTAAVTTLGVDLREVSAADATKQDALGALLDLGDGDDTANFLDTLAVTPEATTIVGVDAELRGGIGNDVLNVTTLDIATVTSPIAATITSGVAAQTDTNANVTGFEAANFTIANQITNAGDTKLNDGTVVAAPAAYAATGALANTRNDNYVGSPTINDDDATDAIITADMARFDSALKNVNLVSQEQPLLMVNQQYEAGTATSFVLNNLGAGVTVSLQAQEATGVTSGALKDDTTTDVNLTVNLGAAAARGLADALTLNLASGSGAFDLNLAVNRTNVDNVGNSASTADDDTMLVEKLTIGLAADDKGHAIVLNGGFGDANYTGYTTNVGTYAQYRNQAGNNDKSVTDYNALTTAQKLVFGQGNSAATEFTLGSATAGTVAGTTTTITGLSADKITLNGAGVVNVSVNAVNNYTVVSGTGADTINMVADTVDDEDSIDGGATGRNTLVINGNNSIGFATASQPENDDAWANKKNLQILEIRANAVGANTNTVVLDEQTFVTGVDTINLTATTKDVSNQTTTIVFGDDFRRDTAITTTDDIVSTQVNITNRVSATDTNQSLTLFANGGAGVVLNDLFGRSKLATTVRVNDAGGATTIASTANAATDGNVDLDVAAGTTGTISSITLVDNNQSATGKVAGDSLDAGTITVTVDNAWSRTTFTLDASAIDNAIVAGGTTAQINASVLDGGLVFNGAAETDATLTVRGTANNDDITGGAAADTLSGGAGNDVVRGGLGADSISGDAGNDTLIGEAGADVIDGGAGNDAITGGTGSDGLTGGTGTDTFNYSDVTESTGATADVISDFTTGTDKISITATVAGGSTVNLGRFSNNGDNTSLEGNAAVNGQVLFDGYYGNGSLAIDVNGDGQINDNLDYSIKSSAAIAAGDINYTLTIGNGANVVRMGQGVDVVTTGTGDDTFVIVGAISSAQAAAYATAGAGVVPAALSKVLPFADLTTARTATEAQAGDKITAGTGTDTLHLYGQVDMTVFSNADGSSTITGFENLVINSDITLTPSQLANVGKLTFNGDSAHVLKIVQPAVGATAAKVFTPAEVTTFLTGGTVTGITPLTAAIPVEITNAGVNTTLTLGTATAAAPATTRTVSEFVADTGVTVQNATDVLTGYSAAQVNKVISNLSKYADSGVTGVLSFSTDITSANLTTLLNSAKVDNTKSSVSGTTGNDTINLSSVTRGYSIDSGAGSDIITSTQARDTINASAGNDTIILTAATTGNVTLGGSTIDITAVDRITGFGSGDTLQLPFVPTTVSGSSTGVAGTGIGVIRGTVSGNTFTPSATGADTLFVYDEDGSDAGTTIGAVLLVGYAPSATGATGGTGSTGTFGG